MTRRTWLGLLLLGAVVCACAERPELEFAAARLAISEAESAGAAERAPGELAAARDKLARAQGRARIGRFDEAQSLAEQAEADARLAALRARAARAETARDTMLRGRASDSIQRRSP